MENSSIPSFPSWQQVCALLLLLLFSVYTNGVKAQDFSTNLDKYLEAHLQQGVFSGTVVVTEKGQVVYQKGFGMADYEKAIPNAETTKYRFGSIGKAFTATLVLQLQEQGKLHVQDKLSKYLPDFPNSDKITLHHLLTHTSGLANYTDTWQDVNGKIPADPGMKVTPKDKVRIDDETLTVKEERPVYLIFNKPANMSATSDPSVRDNVVRAINFPATLEPTAMLEREAEGIIFLSNDSDFTRNIKRGDNRFEKEYVVTVDKQISADFLQKISGGGAPIPGEERVNNAVSKEAQTRFRITLKPGTDHYLKRMCESLGYKVVHMQRIGFGDFKLAKLPAGHWRVLTPKEVDSLITTAQPGKGGAPRRPSESGYSRPERPERTKAAGARGGAGTREKPDRASGTSSRGSSERTGKSAPKSGFGKSGAFSSKGGADRASKGPSRGAQGEGAYKRGTTKSGASSLAKSTRSSSAKGSPKASPTKTTALKGGSKRGEGPKRGR